MLLASSSASGAGGGGPPRQGSPFTHPFISPPQQVGGGGIVEISTGGMLTHYGNSGRDMMVANGMGHGQRPQSGLAPVAKGPGSRHQQQQRSVFDDPVGILEQHAGGGPLAPLSIGLGPDGNFSQDHQGNMMGTNHAMGAGIGERILTNSGGRNMSNSSIADIHGGQPDAAGRMNYGGGAAPISSPHSGQIAAHFQQQQMQRLHLRAAGPGCGLPRTSGGNAMDLGQGRRRSNLGSAGGGGPWAGSEDPMPMALTSIPHSASSLPASAVPTVLERFPGFVRCVMDIAPEVVGWVIGRSGAHIKEMKVRICLFRHFLFSFFVSASFFGVPDQASYVLSLQSSSRSRLLFMSPRTHSRVCACVCFLPNARRDKNSCVHARLQRLSSPRWRPHTAMPMTKFCHRSFLFIHLPWLHSILVFYVQLYHVHTLTVHRMAGCSHLPY